ncbi:MLP-like protein 28 [Cornus florida]|uniref:MLP-like protein 28 n=1 Tax=Cornus florida TaxID=4283 RepID=UPI00289FA449|nr:MLP-like protein 28 [Cornus florida]
MALVGKLEAEVEIDKSNVEEMFHIFGAKSHSISNACAERIPKVEMHEGDWGIEGSIRRWTYVVDGKEEYMKEILTIDEANKTLSVKALEGHVMDLYKSFVGSLHVAEKGETAIAKFTIDYEKLNEDVPVPQKYIDFLVDVAKDVNAHFLKS